VESGAINFAPYYQFWGVALNKLWGNIEESFRSGTAPVNMYEWIEDQPEASRYFQEGMIAIAKYVADDIAKMLIVPPTAKRLLDVGGGHATYSLSILKAYPQLEAVIFDSPQALVTGRENVEAAQMQDRVTFQEGNFVTEELGSGYDVALLFNIIHGFLPEANNDLFKKTARALNPGGVIAIVEQLPDSAPLPVMKTVGQILSASFFHLLGGQIYTYDEIVGWLQKAGFKAARRKNILKGGSTLIMATL
jgi:ubiquinone/menaquinone biosynthesis C-methylase UbiE